MEPKKSNFQKRRTSFVCLFLFGLSLLSHPAWAWDNHQEMMKAWIEYVEVPNSQFEVPCKKDEKLGLEMIGKKIGISWERVPLYSNHDDCTKKVFESYRNLLTGPFIDEPDMGMDQDRPDSDDPRGERAWMGGTQGPTSQGFRHMEFGGWSLSEPLSSFQIPLRKTGYAQERAVLLWKTGDEIIAWSEFPQHLRSFFSLRLKLWSLHILQDLTQPFHTRQILNLEMVPWRTLFSGFVARTTLAISNYHYAYEELALELIRQGSLQPLHQCLGSGFGSGEWDIEKALSSILDLSRKQAKSLGSVLVRFFDPNLKSADVDLPNGIGGIDAYALTQDRERSAVLKELTDMTCLQFKEFSKWTTLATRAKEVAKEGAKK